MGRTILVLLMLLTFTVLSDGRADASEPWRYLQALQALQDRVAHGDRKAYRAQVRLIAYLGREFATMPDETWKERLNAEALFVYVLSGGNPAAATALLERKAEIALPEGALAGAVAFVQGRNGEAWKHLQTVDGRDLSITAQAQLALVKASLRAAAEPLEALDLLARVRLLKPGTLLEEAALRRALFLAGGEGDVKTFMSLASAYIRRFRNSWYVSDFLRRFAWLLVRLDYGREPFLVERMAPLISMLTKRRQALLHAAVARAAVLEGKRSIYPDAPRFAARVKTWIAAAEVVSPDPDEAMEMLKRIPPAKLDERDRQLRTAALVVGRAIVAEPREPDEKAGKVGTSRADDTPVVVVRARAMAAGVRKLLEEGAR